jgi:(1->4)-alpha-D-glucan 1-alpha-D-glucosylmutase
MAKGLEDTAYYRYNRLVSRNEVGASPERLGGTVEAFHRAMIHRREAWPHGLVAGSTHDSKRSEDLRARLHLLSELPGEWQAHAERWARINRRLKRESDGTALPDANTEYLLYQTLLGVWPTAGVDAELAPEVLGTLRARVGAYLEKAAREAKVHTAWIRTDPEYESALAAFVDAVLDPQRNGAFFDDFLPFLGRIAHLGLYTSLSATLLRLTVPGVPDLYQGSELLAFNLVDPDNRRPVDFELRRALLAELEQADAEGRPAQVWPPDPADPGRAKLALIRRGLGLRRADPELFALGDYRPLPVTGTHAERLCAFARTVGGRALVALAPRLLAPLVPPEADQWGADPMADPGWESTWVEVPGPVLVDALAGRELRAERAGDAFGIAAAVALRPFPVGLLSCAHTPAEPTVPV